ncbi:MAG: hypothetical protein Q4F38_05835 [Akkermansia sp.]|nr:hypothetical protein [Akkermansia sp.]
MNTTDKKTCRLCSHLDGEFRVTAAIALLAALASIVGAMTLPETAGGKNALPEYCQLLLIIISTVFALRANNHQTFYKFVFWVLVLIFLREINYGRTLPCFADPDNPEKFKKWKEIPYGWLAHPLIGLYIAAVLAFFFWKKLYLTMWEILTTSRIPVWETTVLVLAAVTAQLSERLSISSSVEELFELTFYTSLLCLLWRFTRGQYKTIPGTAKES